MGPSNTEVPFQWGHRGLARLPDPFGTYAPRRLRRVLPFELGWLADCFEGLGAGGLVAFGLHAQQIQTTKVLSINPI